MRRLIAFMAVLGILLIPPLIASAEMSYENMTTTITATATAPDANIGAMGPGSGQTMLTANDGGTMQAGDNYDVPVTICCLRAKGSGHGAGVHFISASALVNSYMTFCLDATASTNTAATAGASGTCTWHPLRC